MHELASMAANKAQERNLQHNEPSIVNLKVICCYFYHNKQQKNVQIYPKVLLTKKSLNYFLSKSV